MSNELAVIKNIELVPFFTKGDALDDTLAKIAEEARSHVPDVSTKKGRDAIKATVRLVTKSKTYLESNGKELAAEYKAIPKVIDENRKKTKDFLTELQAEIRQPLTDWEEEKKATEAAEKLAEEIKQAELEAIIENMEFDQRKAAEAEQDKIKAEEYAAYQKEQAEKAAIQANYAIWY